MGYFFGFGEVVVRGVFTFKGNIKHQVAAPDQQGDGAGTPQRVVAETRYVFFVSVAAVATEHGDLFSGSNDGAVAKYLDDKAILRVEVGGIFFLVVAFALFPVGFVPSAETKRLIGQRAGIEDVALRVYLEEGTQVAVSDEVAAVIFPGIGFADYCSTAVGFVHDGRKRSGIGWSGRVVPAGTEGECYDKNGQ